MQKSPLPPSWGIYLDQEFQKPYMRELIDFLNKERVKGKIIYPQENEIFAAFNSTPLDKVKVVILGQDPYHGKDQAHGLCFSVRKGVPPPPSLQNIFKELVDDLKVPMPQHGCLESWAKEGVLLLNTVLTVEEGKAGSHHEKGWEIFTDKVIDVLNEQKQNLVYILWGSPAHKKAQKVDPEKNLIIKSVHPSPLSSYRGFFGSKPFSKVNAYLKEKINWEIT